MNFSSHQLGVLLGPNYRSRAILQMLQHHGIKPAQVILLPGNEPAWDGPPEISFPFYRHQGNLIFRPGESARTTLAQQGIPVCESPVADVNAPAFIDFIKPLPGAVYLYSGLAGCILRQDLLRNSGKRFLHAHGGDAPRYSGSTAFYYSLLERGDIGATVFWMEEGLDTGDVVVRLLAEPHKGIEIDRLQDPLLRAEAFVLALEKLLHDDHLIETQTHEERVTYLVIHPVLKHFALRKAGLAETS